MAGHLIDGPPVWTMSDEGGFVVVCTCGWTSRLYDTQRLAAAGDLHGRAERAGAGESRDERVGGDLPTGGGVVARPLDPDAERLQHQHFVEPDDVLDDAARVPLGAGRGTFPPSRGCPRHAQ